jgi:DNA-binding beta-propeller fold protein YncE
MTMRPRCRHLAAAIAAFLATSISTAYPQGEGPLFQGSALLVLSDTDMPSSAFVDGKIITSPRDRVTASDSLTVVRLPVRPAGTPASAAAISELDVSNSVVGPPYGMAASRDGRFVYVLETRGPLPKGTESVPNVFTGLPTRSHVTVVDLRDRLAPKVAQKIEIGSRTHTLDLRADGRMLAVNMDQPGRHIVLFRVGEDGQVGAEVAALGIDAGGQPLRRVGRVQWHPSGEFLSMTLPFDDEVRFYRVSEAGGRVLIEQWGAATKVGDFPDEGAFTPDGSHYISTDLHWGDRPPPNYLSPPKGTFTAVRFDAIRGNHRVTGNAPTGTSPEGIAIAPNGRFVVAANLERSFMPWQDKRLTMGGSLDLLAFDPSSGSLRHIASYPVHGILPEGLAFDASGTFLAATVFDKYDPRRRRGTVEFWRLVEDERPRLERTGYEIEVAPGPHTLLLIP